MNICIYIYFYLDPAIYKLKSHKLILIPLISIHYHNVHSNFLLFLSMGNLAPIICKKKIYFSAQL